MDLFVGPVLSYWLSLLHPAGESEIVFEFELHHIVWIFISLCVMVVAKILEKAILLYEENKLFL